MVRKHFANAVAVVGCFGLAFGAGAVLRADIGTAFKYQGSLVNGNGPVTDTCDFRFWLWDAAAGGNQAGNSPQTLPQVDVDDGSFFLTLDFGPGAMDGTARWLAIEVQCTDDADFVPLDSQRVALTPAPHAIRAAEGVGPPNALEVDTITGNIGVGTVAPTEKLQVIGNAQIDGTVFADALSSNSSLLLQTSGTTRIYADDVTGNVGIGTTTPSAILDVVGTSELNGALTVDTNSLAVDATNNRVGVGTSAPTEALDVVGNVKASGTLVSGNSITIDGTSHSVTSNAELELRVASGRALRIETNATSPNLIGGHSSNTVTSGVVGATIGGGGQSGVSNNNRVTDSFGTVGGGQDNQAGDGVGNTLDKSLATVGGGARNEASGSLSVVAGGAFNVASGFSSFVGGGGGANQSSGNIASGGNSVIGGGAFNSASGTSSTVGGGNSNTASGDVATIGGGSSNTAIGHGATIAGGTSNTAGGFRSSVPGGRLNQAGGDFSLAGGHHAKVRDAAAAGEDPVACNTPDTCGDEGTFVWADSTDAVFMSTGPNQFLIRAGGGMRLATSDGTTPHFQAVLPSLDGSPHVAEDLALNPLGGNVGIGTTTPDVPLHLSGSGADANLASGTGDLAIGDISGANLVVDENEIQARNNGAAASLTLNALGGTVFILPGSSDSVQIGISSTPAKLNVAASSAPAGKFDRQTTDGVIVELQQQGVTEGTISVSGTTVSYNAFTGSHYGWTDETIARGTLVTLTGDNRRRTDDAGAEPTYGIAPTSKANDPKCLGAYLGLLEPGRAAAMENPHQVMAVGNGDMWVVDSGRNIEPGQYLISSDVKGHAMLDDAERFAVGYVVARAGEGVDWTKVSETVDGRKHKRISVFFESFERGLTAASGKVREMDAEISNLKSEISDLKAQMRALTSKNGSAQ